MSEAPEAGRMRVAAHARARVHRGARLLSRARAIGCREPQTRFRSTVGDVFFADASVFKFQCMFSVIYHTVSHALYWRNMTQARPELVLMSNASLNSCFPLAIAHTTYKVPVGISARQSNSCQRIDWA